MTGRVIAVANMKGGVGKTTVVVGLAETLAAVGASVGVSVLVVDADAQANASVCVAGDQRLADLIDAGRTLDALLDDRLLDRGRMTAADVIAADLSRVTHAGARLNISLLPTSAELRLLERELIFELTEQKLGLNAIVGKLFRLLERELDGLRKKYDFILIDCAPGISAVTEASIRLADLVVVPTIPDFLSTYGLAAFCRTLWREDSIDPQFRPRKLPHVVASRRRPIREHERILGQIEFEAGLPDPPFALFKTIIPEAAAIAAGLNPPERDIPFTRKWGQPVIQCLGGLTKEVMEALRVP
jgi:cellulose biosynthesis protein BcsQ